MIITSEMLPKIYLTSNDFQLTSKKSFGKFLFFLEGSSDDELTTTSLLTRTHSEKSLLETNSKCNMPHTVHTIEQKHTQLYFTLMGAIMYHGRNHATQAWANGRMILPVKNRSHRQTRVSVGPGLRGVVISLLNKKFTR